MALTRTLTPETLDREPETCVELLARRALVCRQVREIRAAHDVYVTCPCGSRISVVMAFKCRECHIFFCGPCALRHFGLTESETGRWWIETEEPQKGDHMSTHDTTTGFQIRFDGPPSHETPRFVEVEDLSGRSVRLGEWEQDGEYWLLRVAANPDAPRRFLGEDGHHMSVRPSFVELVKPHGKKPETLTVIYVSSGDAVIVQGDSATVAKALGFDAGEGVPDHEETIPPGTYYPVDHDQGVPATSDDLAAAAVEDYLGGGDGKEA